MKSGSGKTGKRFAVGILAAVMTVVQPVCSVMANPHYDRRDTVAEEELVPSAGAAAQRSSEICQRSAYFI